MIKKGVLVTILISAFLIGLAFGSQETPQTAPQPVMQPAATPLEEAIALFETAVEEGREHVPYSQQAEAQLIREIPDLQQNAVARFGQGIGMFLKTLVREIVRGIALFFGGLIGN